MQTSLSWLSQKLTNTMCFYGDTAMLNCIHYFVVEKLVFFYVELNNYNNFHRIITRQGNFRKLKCNNKHILLDANSILVIFNKSGVRLIYVAILFLVDVF